MRVFRFLNVDLIRCWAHSGFQLLLLADHLIEILCLSLPLSLSHLLLFCVCFYVIVSHFTFWNDLLSPFFIVLSVRLRRLLLLLLFLFFSGEFFVCAFWFFSHSVNSLIQPHKIDINNYCNVKQSGFHLISLFLRFLSLSLYHRHCQFSTRTHTHTQSTITLTGFLGKKKLTFWFGMKKRTREKNSLLMRFI